MLRKSFFLFMIGLLAIQCDLPTADDIIPPIPVLIYPYEGAVVSENIQVRVEASDNKKVKKVWVYLDGEFINETTSKPYLINLDITGKKDGLEHVIQVAAEDKGDNIGYSVLTRFIIAETEDIIDPTVAILNPAQGQTVEGTVNITAFADDDRSVREVVFFLNGDSIGSDFSNPYNLEWDTTPFSDSTNHTIYAKAFDSGGNSTISEVVTVTVFPRVTPTTDIIAPSVLLLYPVNEYTVSGTVAMRADADDNIAVTSVEFFVDGALQGGGVLNNGTWLYNWDSSTKTDSTQHTIYLKASDAAGNTGTSAISTVLVRTP